MKTGEWITFMMGAGLTAFAGWHFYTGLYLWASVILIIGAGLLVITFYKNRYAQVIFGHLTIVAGCMLTTAGLLYIPLMAEGIKAGGYQITLAHIFGMPLFWGMFSIFGGICAIYHGFCRCIRCKTNQ